MIGRPAEGQAKCVPGGMSRPAGTSSARMTLDPQKRRSPAQVRAGNLRLALILIGVVAVFFLGAVVKQWLVR